jgi:hypothetical protein
MGSVILLTFKDIRHWRCNTFSSLNNDASVRTDMIVVRVLMRDLTMGKMAIIRDVIIYYYYSENWTKGVSDMREWDGW